MTSSLAVGWSSYGGSRCRHQAAAVGGGPSGTVSPVVAYGLLAAWAVHDLEEVLAVGHWAHHALPRPRQRFPGVPGRAGRPAGPVDERRFASALSCCEEGCPPAGPADLVSAGRC